MERRAQSPKPQTSWDKDNWRMGAGCHTVDPGVFFPDANDEKATAAAKAICATCPVREFCLDFALATRQDDGVWGGLDEDERRRIRRRQQRQNRPRKPVRKAV